MSAFVVSHAHIDTLLYAALYLTPLDSDMNIPGYPEPDPERPGQYIPLYVNRDTATRYGAILLAENIASVEHRYADSRAEVRDAIAAISDASLYRFNPRIVERVAVSPVQVLKAIESYQYQSCEHPGWETSLAKRFCDALTAKAIRNLPGYFDAAWSIDDAA